MFLPHKNKLLHYLCQDLFLWFDQIPFLFFPLIHLIFFIMSDNYNLAFFMLNVIIYDTQDIVDTNNIFLIDLSKSSKIIIFLLSTSSFISELPRLLSKPPRPKVIAETSASTFSTLPSIFLKMLF